jgi:hypothetical protein
MKLLPIKEFSRVRLKTLLPGKDIDRTWGYEYIGKMWLGETHAFSHALRLFSRPFQTRSIALDLSDVSDGELLVVSQKLGLKVLRDYTADQCRADHGAPVEVEGYADDRKTYVYFLGDGPDYEVGFTILNNGGLAYITMDTFDVAYNNPVNKDASS